MPGSLGLSNYRRKKTALVRWLWKCTRWNHCLVRSTSTSARLTVLDPPSSLSTAFRDWLVLLVRRCRSLWSLCWSRGGKHLGLDFVEHFVPCFHNENHRISEISLDSRYLSLWCIGHSCCSQWIHRDSFQSDIHMTTHPLRWDFPFVKTWPSKNSS